MIDSISTFYFGPPLLITREQLLQEGMPPFYLMNFSRQKKTSRKERRQIGSRGLFLPQVYDSLLCFHVLCFYHVACSIPLSTTTSLSSLSKSLATLVTRLRPAPLQNQSGLSAPPSPEARTNNTEGSGCCSSTRQYAVGSYDRWTLVVRWVLITSTVSAQQRFLHHWGRIRSIVNSWIRVERASRSRYNCKENRWHVLTLQRVVMPDLNLMVPHWQNRALSYIQHIKKMAHVVVQIP